jgi:hypothetical protein
LYSTIEGNFEQYFSADRVPTMVQNPPSHASDALSSLTLRLHNARVEERVCGERLDAIDTDLALQRARLDAEPPASERRRTVIAQRIAGLLELRSALTAERVRRRREIDEMEQRKEAISAALAVLRARSSALPA